MLCVKKQKRVLTYWNHFLKCMFGMCKVFFALPLANDASVCYGMSRLSFLIMKMYRVCYMMLSDIFWIKDSMIYASFEIMLESFLILEDVNRGGMYMIWE